MAEHPSPTVSVVVPVRNRRALLRSCLDALGRQTFADFEVIVVDDGSVDGSGEEARRTPARVPVRVVGTEGVGAVAARRAGVVASAAPLLAFTDSDCVSSPRWLELGVEALQQGADMANGLTLPARPPDVLEHSVASGEEGLYPTCNLFLTREAYDRAGGFDTDAHSRLGFRPGRGARGLGFGEDTLLAWRVKRRGTVAFVPGALVHHGVLPVSFWEAASRAWMAGAFPALVREVPELRATLLRQRLFLGRPGRSALYLSVGALALGRRRLARLAAAYWVADHLHNASGRSWSERLQGLPTTLALDALTGAALVIGSIRARSVTL